MVQALHFRNANRAVFEQGDYQALQVVGSAQNHICAFSRSLHGNGKRVISAVPRLLSRLTENALVDPLGPRYWQGTALIVSPEPGLYRNVLTAEVVEAILIDGQYQLPAEKVFASFPVALLEQIQ